MSSVDPDRGGTGYKLREQAFHDQRFAVAEGARDQDRFYRALHRLYQDFASALRQFSADRDVLEIGCGNGKRIFDLAATGSPRSATGIDLSPVVIEHDREFASSQSRHVRFEVDDGEATRFSDQSFDLVFGSGILHHLRLEAAVRELVRLTRPGATLVFLEPLATNPLISLYRRLTPKARSPDEHPLRPADIRLLQDSFAQVQVAYYGFLTVLAMPLYSQPQYSRIFGWAQRVDGWLLRGPARWLAWSVLVVARR